MFSATITSTLRRIKASTQNISARAMISYLNGEQTSMLKYLRYKLKHVFISVIQCVGTTKDKRVVRSLDKCSPTLKSSLMAYKRQYTYVESSVMSCKLRQRFLSTTLRRHRKYQQMFVLFASSFPRSEIVFVYQVSLLYTVIMVSINNLTKAE